MPAERDSGCSESDRDMTDETANRVIKHLEWLNAMEVMWFDAPPEDGQCQAVVRLPLAIQQKILGALDVRFPAPCRFCFCTPCLFTA